MNHELEAWIMIVMRKNDIPSQTDDWKHLCRVWCDP